MAAQYLVLLSFFLCRVRAIDINFNDCTNPAVGCSKSFSVDCDIEDQLSGSISSPYYPSLMGFDYVGVYEFVISSCSDSVVLLTLTDNEFNLGAVGNTFTVGTGESFGSSILSPVLYGKDTENEFPDNVDTLNYGGKANSMWFRANLPGGSSAFKITFTVTVNVIEEYNYTQTSDTIKSDEPYPNDQLEQRHFIDVSGNGDGYWDLLFTVVKFNISGINGDFIKLGPGLDYSQAKDSGLLSWQLNRGKQFLINGPKANLIFSAMKPVVPNDPIQGFEITYEAISKNLTTAAPSTTPEPTFPTPLPYDPEILSIKTVFYDYIDREQGRSPEARLFSILRQYADSNNMDPQYFTPEFDESIIGIELVETCYHGWNIDPLKCAQTEVMAKAFYQNSTMSASDYAFTAETFRAAVRRYGGQDGIYLPDDLTDIYWVAVGIFGGIVLLILLVLLVAWRQKLQLQYKKQKKYKELRSDKSSSSGGQSSMPNKSPISGSSLGIDNPNFIPDEDYEPQRSQVMTYDPEKGTLHPARQSNSDFYNYSESGSVASGSYDQSDEIIDAAVLDITPSTNNFQWRSNSSAAGTQDNSLLKPVSRNEMISDTIDDQATLSVPKRGILKTMSIMAGSSISSEVDEMEDVVLYDSTPVVGRSPIHYVPSSSSASSRNNSITNDPTTYRGQPQFGIYLEDFDEDDFGETNL